MKNENKNQPKTKEELDALKTEVKALKKKLAELTEEELEEVVGGVHSSPVIVKTIPFCSGAGGHTVVKEEEVLKEMKLPDFNLN